MRTIMLIVTLLASLSVFSADDQATENPDTKAQETIQKIMERQNEAPAQAKSFQVTRLSGRPIQVGRDPWKYEASEPLIILHFWATWCEPCVAEFPSLIKFATENKDIWIVAVATQNHLANVREFIATFDHDMPSNLFIVVGSENSWEEPADDYYKIPGMPSNYLVNRDGMIVAITTGGPTDWQGDKTARAMQAFREAKPIPNF